MLRRKAKDAPAGSQPTGVPPGYYHPYGRLPNALIHMGATLAIAQAIVFGLYWFSFPAIGDVALEGAGLLAMLLVVAAITVGSIWLSWRGLMTWRDRSPKALWRLLVPGLIFMPLGALDQTALLFTPAGMLLVTGVLLARPRVPAAERAGLGRPDS